jgi:glycosyltransferase involved in cell wall biosynthesis
MKVVVAHNRYSSAQPSGENTMVDVEIAALTGAGVEVVPFLRSSDEIATMSPARKALLPLSVIYARQAQAELARLIRTERPDLLHLHNPYPLLSPWIVRTAQAHGVPVVQTVHNYRQVCAAGTFYRDGAVCTDCVGRILPLPAVAHGCYRGSRAQSVVMASALVAHRGTWRRVDRYIALTDAVRDHLIRYGVAADRIVVKPNSVPDPGEPTPLGDGFLALGRLVSDKGVSLLLSAWRRHPEGSLGRLRVVGDGPLRAEVERAATERADISYLGVLDAAGVRGVLRESAVLVAASTWHDVLPSVILEALSCGRPVLGTRMGGIPSLIGAAGWLTEPTVDALAEALPRARAEAAGLAAAARQRYVSAFHPEVVLARQLEIYRDLVASPTRGVGSHLAG